MNQSTEIVSIIMPVKNAGSYLHDGLSSIRGQTFSFWQLIAINDHSTDKSLEILEAAAAKDERICVFQNQGKGIIPALQTALSHCTGRWITRMDADDLMPENRLEAMVNAIRGAPPKTIVTGKVRYFSNEVVSDGYLKYENWLNQRIEQHDHWQWVYRECVIASPNWMVQTADLLEMGGFDGLSYPEDYHLVLKWFEIGFSIKCLDQVTLHWQEHPARTSRNSEHYDQQHFFELKVGHFIQHQLNEHKLVLWGTGPKGKLTARILEKHGTDFEWMDMLTPGAIQKSEGRSIQDFRSIETLSDYKLLIAVYPPEKERAKMEAYLVTLGKKLSQDYWYL